jgi:glutathione S-transferase
VSELYHHFLSTCSQKVRLVLAEKGVEFESHPIDLMAGQQHDPDYVKLNPNHVVPTLVHDGRVYIESSLINEYVEDAFEGPTCLASDPGARHAARLWVKRIDEKVHPQAGVITFGIGTRPMILAQTQDQIDAMIAAIPDPKNRAKRASVIEHGVKAPEMVDAFAAFTSLLDDLDAALEGAEWLAGEAWSLAEAAVTPYVIRLDHLGLSSLIEARKNTAAWYERVQQRANFEKAVTQWVPEAVVGMFRANGEAVADEVRAIVTDL